MLCRTLKDRLKRNGKAKHELQSYCSDEVRTINHRRQCDNGAGRGLKTLQHCLGLAPVYEAEETNVRLCETLSQCQCTLPCEDKDQCQRRYQSNWQDVVFVAIDTEGCSVRQLGEL